MSVGEKKVDLLAKMWQNNEMLALIMSRLTAIELLSEIVVFLSVQDQRHLNNQQ